MARLLHVGGGPRALESALRERGHDVRAAPGRAEAVAAFVRERAEAVLVETPLDEALETCRALKALARGELLPVVLVAEDPAARARALREGADDALAPPVDVEELEARLAALLRVRERQERLKAETGRFKAIALTDPLTRLGNRRAFDGELRRGWARAARSGRPLALVLLDLDRFKEWNDRHGHPSGDAVLRAVARALGRAIRTGDQGFRIGGEELAVLAADTPLEGAVVLAERIRSAVAASCPITASLGVAVGPARAIASPGALVEVADRALYQAKLGGRDRVAVGTAGKGGEGVRVCRLWEPHEGRAPRAECPAPRRPVLQPTLPPRVPGRALDVRPLVRGAGRGGLNLN